MKMILFENKIIKKKHFELVLIMLISMLFSYFFLINSNLHPLIKKEAYTDSSVFKTVALMMQNGYMPYLDSFDHKGPIIYILNYLANLVDYYSGVWYFEWVLMSISFIFSFFICRLFIKNEHNFTMSIIISLLAFLPYFKFFEGGNLVEEYALPCILVSLYYYLKILYKYEIKKYYGFICGICFSIVVLLRPNMISLWIVFNLIIFIKMLLFFNNNYIVYFITFVTGIILICSPILFWLISNDSFKPFIDDYFIFNFFYCNQDSLDYFSKLLNMIICIGYFLLTPFCLLPIFLCFVFLYKRNVYALYNMIYIIINLLFITLSGKRYGHYGIIIIPSLILPYVFFVNTIKLSIHRVVFIISCFAIILVTWLPTLKSNYIYINLHKTNYKFQESTFEICNIVDKFTAKDDKILVYGNKNIYYVVTKRMHATKYSYQTAINLFNNKLFFDELKMSMPKLIITSINDESIDTFLNDNRYTCVYDGIDKVYVYNI